MIGYDRPNYDRHKTSYEKDLPGVILHAQMVSYLLDVVLDGRPKLKVLPRWGNSLWIMAWGLISGSMVLILLRLKTSSRVMGVAIAAAALILSSLCFALLAQVGLWLPVISSLMVLSIIPVVQIGIMSIVKEEQSLVYSNPKSYPLF